MNTNPTPPLSAGKLDLLWRRLKQNAVPKEQDDGARRVPLADRSRPLPLSFAQQRLWFMDQLDHAAGQAYHMPVALRLQGRLDKAALIQALDTVVARHEGLRTRFVQSEGETVQEFAAPDCGLALVESDLSHLEGDAREAALTRVCADEVAAPFDLARGPLIRGQLLRLWEQEHVLLITQHHIVSDGWSIGVLVQEVCTLYAAFSSGSADPLPPLAIQYADYAAWQRGWLQGSVLRGQIDFWKSYLGGAPALLELPADHPRPAVQSYAGASLPFTLDASLTAAVRDLSQRHGTTLFMTLLAAWSVLLARVSGQHDIVVGTPVANRQRSECEGLIGLFVNTLALRVRVGDDHNVAELLAQVKADTLAAYANQDLPFEQVVEALQPARSLSHSPLFQVMLSMNNTIGGAAGRPQSLAGLTVARIEHEQTTTQFDLSVSFSEGPSTLQGNFEYASDLFDAERIARLANQFRTLLAAMAADDQQAVGRLPLLDAAERRHVLVGFNDNDLAYPEGQVIQQAFEEQVLRHPDAIAVVHEHRSLSYAELNARANQLAHCLTGMGVAPDDRVAVCVERGTDMVVAMLGVLKAGAAYVPLDPAYPAERLAFALQDSGPVVLVAHAGLRAGLPALALPVVELDADAGRLAAQPSHNPDPAALGLGAGNLAYVIYTSGSTGLPKGVMVEHRNVVNFVHAHVQACELTAADRVLQFASFGFDVHAGEIFPALSIGATVVIRPSRIMVPDAAFVELLRVHAITVSDLPSAFWHQWTQDIVRDGAAPATALRLIIAGGEKVEHRHLVAWHGVPGMEGCRWLNTYGPTEATVTMTAVGYNPGDTLPPHEVPIGRPVANTRVYILDRHMEPVPVGVAGEMYLGGACVARGYLNRPELNEERFVADPFSATPALMYRSGDLARWWSDGNIEYLGRNDHQVKLRGFRIEPGEIETRLFACEGVRDAVVTVREDTPGDKRLVAYLLADEGVRLEPAALRAALAASLPDYMVPGAFVTLDAFPLTVNGKLDRPALPAPGNDALIQRAYEAPEGETEIVLAAIWQELLGVKNAGRQDHFFELGGHSLLAVQVVSRVRQALGVEVPLRDLFGEPTLSGFARAIGAAGRSDLGALTAADRSAPLALSYAQQRLWFLQELDQAAGAAYHMPVGLRLHGRLHKTALRRALARIVERHEALRTVFVNEGGHPRQQTLPAAEFALVETDLSALPGAVREAAAARIGAQEAAAPFDLAQGPLIRGQLLAMDADEHILLITQHHIVSDGWSINLLVREFGALYSAFAQDQSDPLPPLAIQYADFAAWQRSWLQGEVLQGQVDFWTTHLAGAPTLLALPTDRARPAVQSYAGATHAVRLGADLTARLRALGQRHGTTLFMTLLSGWALTMARLAGQHDVVIGTPVANRQRSEVESLIGFFVNTLALRVRLDDNPSVAQLLAQVRQTTLGAYQHQDLPFEQVVDILKPVRSMGHSPLFQVMLSMDSASGGDTLDLPGLTLSPVDAEHKTTHFDINLQLSDAGDDIGGNLEYASDLFDAATIARMVGCFQTVLAAMVADDTRGVDRIALLDEAQQRRMIAAGASRAAFPDARPVHLRFEEQAARDGEAIALVFDGRQLSYAELNRRANQVAHYLIAQGVQPGQRVALCVERGLEMVVGLLGILKAGAGYVPMDPAYPADRLAYMLADSAPAAVLTQSSVRARLSAGAGAVPVLSLDGERDQLAVRHTDNPGLAVDANSLAYVIYTSGSTGQPKGVMVSHANVARLFDATEGWFDFGSSDVWTLFHSISFDFSVWEVWGALCHGGKLVVVPGHVARSPQDFYGLLCQEGVTVLNQTPSSFRQLIAAQDDRSHSLRTIVFGGEALELRSLAPWIARNDPEQTRLVNMYGITEITVHATYRLITRADIEGGAGSVIGAALPDLQMYLLDGDLQPVPYGVTGELYIGGAGVALAYLNREELTAQRFIANPFATSGRLYKTGDLARRLPDGDIEYQGRNDCQVKIRGFRIELGEIEAKLAACEGVREAVVIAREDTPGDKRLVAYLIAGEGAAPAAASLREQLLASLAEYMVPSAFVLVDAYPLTANGKLDTRALPAPDASAVVARTFEAPEGELEVAIAAIWQELLGVERVGRHDHFFELGGHSLLAVQLVSRIRAEIGVELPLRELFTEPALCAVARKVAGARQSAMNDIVVVDRSQPMPLSWSQQRLWFLDQLDRTASASYHLPSGLRLKGALDQAALRATLDRIVARHENLRTTFALHAGEPVQVIHPATIGFALEEQDLSALSGHEQEFALARVSTVEAGAPFDLAAGPLIRGRLLRMAADEHVLLVTMHHIVSDGWSNGVLVHELGTLYRAFTKGEADPLPPLAIQYADYAAWQRGWLKGDVLETQIAYWKERLGGAPALLELPSDHARPATRSYVGGSAPFSLPAELGTRLHALGQRHGATLFMTLLAGWSAMLSRLSGQTDVVIGTSVANRSRREVEPLIGFFVNSLALRVQMDDDPDVATLVERVRADTLDAYAHQDLPFEQVVEALKPPRSMSHSPLFQVLFSLNNTPAGASLALPGLTLSGVGHDHAAAQFDLALRMAEVDGALVGTLEYAADLYTQVSAERMVQRFATILASMADGEQLRVSELQIMDAAERRHLLVDANATAMPIADSLIHQQFEIQAALHPDGVAVVAGGESISYGELNRRANQLAHLLRARGVRPDGRVALCFERGVPMIVAILGVLKAGGAYVPLDPSNPEERLSYMLADCAPVALLTQADLEDSLPALSLLSVIVLDSRADRAQLARQPDHNPDPAQFGLNARHLAYVIYTSGSTGQSKGVTVEHRSAVNFWQVMCDTTHAECPAGARIALNAAYTFDMSLKGILQLLSGHALYIIPQDIRADAPAMLGFLQAHRIDAFDCTPSQLEILLGAGMLSNAAWQPGSVLIGGEPIGDAMWNTLKQARQVRFFNMYGPTEATVDATLGRILPEDETPHIGRPLGNARIYLLDAARQPVPLGAAGEIYIGGAGVARGYLNRAALSAERFVADPFAADPDARMYKTGDLGRWLADGNIGYLGRNDFQVKIRGFRIELGEIEACLLACPGVREALVVAREDQPGDKRLVAYLVAHEDDAPAVAELRRELASRLPDYMVPSAFVTLSAFPLNANGKLDRRALPAPDVAAAALQQYEAPLSWHEVTIAAIWQDLIGLERVGRQDHFFDLGGHSLLAVQLVSRLRRECGVEIALRELFGNPLLCDFAAVIERMALATRPAEVNCKLAGGKLAGGNLVILRDQGSQAPLFFVHPGEGEVGYARVLAEALDPSLPVYALAAQGLQPGETADTSAERMAERYLAALRQVQPAGPYRLAGWSAGGTIAYAMAHQLEQAGERVDYLGLIDTMADYPALPGGDAAAADHGHALAALAPPGRPDLQAALALQLAAGDIDAMLAILQQADILPRDMETAMLRRHLAVRHAIAVAVRRYAKPQLAAPLSLYLARAEERDDPLLGWGGFVRHALQLHCLDADHRSIVDTEHAMALARAIGTDLQQAALAHTLQPTALPGGVFTKA